MLMELMTLPRSPRRPRNAASVPVTANGVAIAFASRARRRRSVALRQAVVQPDKSWRKSEASNLVRPAAGSYAHGNHPRTGAWRHEDDNETTGARGRRCVRSRGRTGRRQRRGAIGAAHSEAHSEIG